MTAEEFEAIFHGIDLPESVQLETGVKVIDVRKFIDTQILILKNNKSTQYKTTVENRLLKLKEIIGV